MTTYYVTKSGNDSNNGTAVGTAFLTIGKATGLVNAGDTIIVSAGTYQEQLTINRSGSAGSPITLRAATGETVIIGGAGNPVNSGSWFGLLHFNAQSHWRVQNLTVSYGSYYNIALYGVCVDVTLEGLDVHHATADRGISVDGNQTTAAYVTIKNCKVHDCPGGGIVVWTCNGGYILIDGCEVYNIANAGNVDAIEVGSGDGVAHHVIIQNCYVHDNVMDSVDLGGHSATLPIHHYLVQNNVIDGVLKMHCGDNTTLGAVFIPGSSGLNMIIRNNIIRGGLLDIYDYPDPIVVYHNTFFGSGQFWRTYRDSQAGRLNPEHLGDSRYVAGTEKGVCIFKNNAYIRTAGAGTGSSFISINDGVDPGVSVAYQDIQTKGNMFRFSGSGTGDIIYWGNPVTYYGMPGSFATLQAAYSPNFPEVGSTITTQTPAQLFVNPSASGTSYDFRLTAGSDLRGKGKPITKTTAVASYSTTITVERADYFCDGWGMIPGDKITCQNYGNLMNITAVNSDANTITIDTPVTLSIGDVVGFYNTNILAPDVGAYQYVATGTIAPANITHTHNLGTTTVSQVVAGTVSPNAAHHNHNLSATTITVIGSGGPTIAPGYYYEFPDTSIVSKAPGSAPQGYGTGAANILNSWGGTSYDTSRHRLLMWGGGPNYGGNEAYLFDVSAGATTKIGAQDAYGPFPGGTAAQFQVDGDVRPVSRQTFGFPVYLPVQDKHLIFGGAQYNIGYGSYDTHSWTFNAATNTWASTPLVTANSFNAGSDYNTADNKVYFITSNGFSSYNPATLTTTIEQQWESNEIGSAVAVDPSRGYLFVLIGTTIKYFNIATKAKVVPTMTGDTSWTATAALCWDSTLSRLMVFDGKGACWAINASWVSTKYTAPGSVPNPIEFGTLGWYAAGKVHYDPTLKVFIMAPSGTSNMWAFNSPLAASSVTLPGALTSSTITPNSMVHAHSPTQPTITIAGSGVQSMSHAHRMSSTTVTQAGGGPTLVVAPGATVEIPNSDILTKLNTITRINLAYNANWDWTRRWNDWCGLTYVVGANCTFDDNGGHNDMGDNNFMYWDWAAWQWVQGRPADLYIDDGGGRMHVTNNGAPVVRHVYHSECEMRTVGKIFKAAGSAQWNNGSYTDQIDWIITPGAPFTVQRVPAGAYVMSHSTCVAVAWDTKRNRVFGRAGGAVYTYDPSNVNNTVVLQGAPNGDYAIASMCYHQGRDWMICIGYGQTIASGHGLTYHDLAGIQPNVEMTDLTFVGDAPNWNINSAIEYDEDTGTVVVFDPRNGWWELLIGANKVVTVKHVAMAGVSTIPITPASGELEGHGKLQYMRDKKLFCAQRYTSNNMVLYRTSTATGSVTITPAGVSIGGSGGGGTGVVPKVTPLSLGVAMYAYVARPGDVSVSADFGDRQADIKTTWPNGSARHILMVEGITSGDVSLSRFLANNSGTVTYTAGGTVYTVNLGAMLQQGSTTLWRTGGKCNEWLFAGPKTHPRLQLRGAIAFFANGTVRWDLWMENAWIYGDRGDVTYDVSIVLNGATVYSKTGLVHYRDARWRKTFWTNGSQVQVAHDLDYLRSTETFLAYDTSIVIDSAVQIARDRIAVGTTAYYEPMQAAGLQTGMDSAGGREEIGPISACMARFLINGSQDSKNRGLLQQNMMGTCFTHWRDPATDLPTKITDHPWLNAVTSTVNPTTGIDEGTTFPASANIFSFAQGQMTHAPDPGFFGYVLTGDYYYLEELMFWATWALQGRHPIYRSATASAATASDGIMTYPSINHWEVRDMAWSWRTWTETTAFLPTGHPMKSYFDAITTNNINFLNAALGTMAANPLHIADTRVWGVGGGPNTFMDDFWTSMLGHSYKLGFTAILPTAIWRAQCVQLRMAATHWEGMACYALATFGPSFNNNGAAATTWSQVMLDTATANGTNWALQPAGFMPWGSNTDPESYGAIANMAVAVATDILADATLWAKWKTVTNPPVNNTEPQFSGVIPFAAATPGATSIFPASVVHTHSLAVPNVTGGVVVRTVAPNNLAHGHSMKVATIQGGVALPPPAPPVTTAGGSETVEGIASHLAILSSELQADITSLGELLKSKK